MDPQEGGVENNYVYPPDPVNEFDLDGQWGNWKSLAKSVTRVAAIGAMIPGPVGMAFTAAQMGAELAQGNWRGAAIAAGGIALAAAGVGVVKVAPKITAAVKSGALKSSIKIAAKSLSPLHGKEFAIGKDFRIKPFGFWKGKKWYEKLPHYHKRIVDKVTGVTKPGQGIGKHRPWQR